MAKIMKVRKAADPKRALLNLGLSLVLLGTGLFVASRFLGTHPNVASLAQNIRWAAPWAVFVGALVLLLYAAVRKGAMPARLKQPDPIVFGQSTTTFQEPEAFTAAREREQPAAMARPFSR